MILGLAAGAQAIDHLADCADLVLDRVWSARSILETCQFGEQVLMDKLQ